MVAAFLFTSRSATIDSAQVKNFTVQDDALVFTERFRKSKQAWAERRLEVPVARCGAAAALAAHFHWRREQGQVEAPVYDGGVKAALTKTVDEFNLDDSLRRTTHALRRGAAICMHSLRIEARLILSWGGWAGEASLKPYIEQQVLRTATAADEAVFGWLHSLRRS